MTNKKTYTYKGKDYTSIYKLATELNIKPEYIYGRIKSGLTLEEAVQNSLSLIRTGKLNANLSREDSKGKIKVWTELFNDTSEIETSFGLEKDFIQSSLKKESKDINGDNIEKLIIEHMRPEVNENKKRLKTTTALARFYGQQPDTIYQRLKLGWDLTEAVVAPVRKRHVDKIEYKGRFYTSQTELAKDYNIDSYWIASTARKQNSSWMKIFEAVESFISDNELNTFENFPSVIGTQYSMIFDGVWFRTINEIAEKHSIKKSSYTNTVISERLDYLKEVLGEPEGECFNYKDEWNKFTA